MHFKNQTSKKLQVISIERPRSQGKGSANNMSVRDRNSVTYCRFRLIVDQFEYKEREGLFSQGKQQTMALHGDENPANNYVTVYFRLN